MKKLVSEHIENAKLYPPGKPLEELKREYGIEDIVKLNANENNLGPSPLAVRAIVEGAAGVHRYPDNSAFYLKRRLAEMHGLAAEQLILGNGSNELVQFIIMTFLCPGEEVLTATPTFVLYGIMARAVGGTLVEVPLRDFRYDLDRMAEAVSERTKIIFISNPNNPTGTAVAREAFDRFMKAVPEDVIVVVDEAYFEYVTDPAFPDAVRYVREKANVIVLRTFSKAYGLAGLRIGYGAAPRQIVEYMERIREPFNANALAQAGALAALEDAEHLSATRENNRQGLEQLSADLERLGLRWVPSQANFVLVDIGPRAEAIYDGLMRAGVMVRHFTGCGLDECLRVTVGRPEENRKFIEALESLLAQTTGGK